MFSFPTVATIVSSTATEGVALFTQFLPLAYFAIIVTLAVVGLMYLRKWITGGVKRVGGAGGRRGRRRR